MGSASWITDKNGQPIQYMHYAPYGELIANYAPYRYDERFKFTGKERDWETGYDFFGARYYFHLAGIWLGVDPLAHKYPGVTPYIYCGGNPVMLVDPDGKVLNISGALSFEALSQLQNIIGETVKLTIDETGLVCYEKRTDVEFSSIAAFVCGIIDDESIVVNITTIDGDKTPDGSLFLGGAFMGNTVMFSAEGYVDGVVAEQLVNPHILNLIDTYSRSGTTFLHEVTEAYFGALISALRKASSPNAKGINSVYNVAHDMATPQPVVYQSSYDQDNNITEIDKAVRVERYVQSLDGKERTIVQTIE